MKVLFTFLLYKMRIIIPTTVVHGDQWMTRLQSLAHNNCWINDTYWFPMNLNSCFNAVQLQKYQKLWIQLLVFISKRRKIWDVYPVHMHSSYTHSIWQSPKDISVWAFPLLKSSRSGSCPFLDCVDELTAKLQGSYSTCSTQVTCSSEHSNP